MIFKYLRNIHKHIIEVSSLSVGENVELSRSEALSPLFWVKFYDANGTLYHVIYTVVLTTANWF